MNKRIMSKWILGLMVILMAGCADREASFETVELARKQAKDNSSYVAQVWRSENDQYSQWNLIARGDSTISPACPQGDGWASMELQNPKRLTEKLGLKCSTYSAGLGCVKSEEFKSKKQYSSQENRCNKDVPHPLPKMIQ